MAQFRAAIAPGGLGVIAHSAADGHYIDFHRRFLAAFGPAEAAPYVAADTIVEALQASGVQLETQSVHYDSIAGTDDTSAVEGYLQRCAFDTRACLAQMQATAPLAEYLAACHGPQGWRFPQHVTLITVAV